MESLIQANFFALLIFLPLLAFVFLPFKSKSRNAFYLLLSLVPVLNMALLWKHGYHFANSDFEWRAFQVFSLSMDHYSYLFLWVGQLAWLLTIAYTSGYLRHHFQSQARSFHGWIALSMSASTAVALSENFFTLLVGYASMALIVYQLITLDSHRLSRAAGKMYLKSILLPFFLLLVPAISSAFPMLTRFQFYHVGDLGFTPLQESLILTALIVGFSMNCVFPFHRWLPKTAKVAPVPVSALVHSVTAVQTAMIVIFKIGVEVYGLSTLHELNEHFFQTGWITYLCGLTAIYTAYLALKAQELKMRFSYSTVGQISYILTAFLIGTPTSFLAGSLHIATHAFAKLNLFFMSGVFSTALGSTHASKVARWVPAHRWAAAAVALSGLSIAGFPMLAGFYSKDMMLLEEIHSHHYAAAAFLLLGSLINFLYIWPVIRAGLSKVNSNPLQNSLHEPKAVPRPMLVAVGLCCVLIVLLSKYVQNVVDLLKIS